MSSTSKIATGTKEFNNVRTHELLRVSTAAVGLAISLWLTSDAYSFAAQSRTCNLTQYQPVPADTPPDCFGSAAIIVQNAQDGVCTVGSCGPAETCSFDIYMSLSAYGYPSSEIMCDFDISLNGQGVASCASCAFLEWQSGEIAPDCGDQYTTLGLASETWIATPKLVAKNEQTCNDCL